MSKSHTPGSSAWQQIFQLAEQLTAESTIAGQRDRIVATGECLVGGDARLWLAESVYRLTDPEEPASIPSEPASELMCRAFDSGEVEIESTPAIALPLKAQGEMVGVLQIERPAGPPFSDGEIEWLRSLATQSAIALENQRRYEESQAQAWISTVLLQVAEATQSLSTLDEVLETVVRLTPLLAGVDRCAILLWDEPPGVFEPGAAYGLGAPQQAGFRQLRIAPGDALAFDELRFIKEPIAVRDAAADTRLPADVATALGSEPALFLPLIARDEVVGMMWVDDRSEESQFEEEWHTMMQGIAQQAATAIESTRLLEAQQEEAYVLASLLQVAETVASRNDLDETLRAILRVTAIMVGVERAIIFLQDERGSFQVAQTYGVSGQAEAQLQAQRYAAGEIPLLDTIHETHQPILLDTPERWNELVPPDFVTQFANARGNEPRSVLAVPLSLQDNVLGAMLIEEDDEASRRFREKRMEIIEGVAQQAALAVQNERFRREMAARERLEQELQLAREIQQRLMPSDLPDLPGWELAATCRPALQVGGDFYDFFELPGGRLGMVIADVADKGMPAALFMALTRALVRAAALEETSPAAALTRVNDLLVPDAHGGMFVTAAYAVLALETGTVTYTNAGHNPPLLCRPAAGEVQRLARGGMALGVLEGVQLDEWQLPLEPGEHLILYTDGVTEAFSAEDRAFGDERLQATVRAAADVPARAMLDTIDGSVSTFIGDKPPSDDLTLLVLRRQGLRTHS